MLLQCPAFSAERTARGIADGVLLNLVCGVYLSSHVSLSLLAEVWNALFPTNPRDVVYFVQGGPSPPDQGIIDALDLGPFSDPISVILGWAKK